MLQLTSREGQSSHVKNPVSDVTTLPVALASGSVASLFVAKRCLKWGCWTEIHYFDLAGLKLTAFESQSGSESLEAADFDC